MESASSLLGRSWQSYKSRFWELTLVYLTPLLIGLLIRENVASSLIMVIFLLIVQSIIALGLNYAVIENIPIKEGLRKGLNNILGFWWVGVLSFLIVLGGLSLLIVPGLIFGIWFMFTTQVFVVESQRGLSALLKSKQYVQGSGWDLFGKLLYLGLIGFLVFASSTLIVAAIGPALKSVIPFFTDLINVTIGAVLSIISVYYLFYIFEGLKKIHLRSVNLPIPQKRSGWILVIVWGLIIIFVLPLVGPFVLNPSGLIKEARDAQRIADLGSLKTTIDVYNIYNTQNLPEFSVCEFGKIYSSDQGTTAMNGTGWLPFNFDAMPGGSPIFALPKDPINSEEYVYKFACDMTPENFELSDVLESSKYKTKTGRLNKGNNVNAYELGTNLNLIP